MNKFLTELKNIKNFVKTTILKINVKNVLTFLKLFTVALASISFYKQTIFVTNF